MDTNRTFTIPSGVMARAVGSEIVLLDLDSGTYFGLDTVGSRLWQLFEQGKSIAEACDVLINEYEVDYETLLNDAQALAEDLLAKKLMRD